jgi:hypothetical protein
MRTPWQSIRSQKGYSCLFPQTRRLPDAVAATWGAPDCWLSRNKPGEATPCGSRNTTAQHSVRQGAVPFFVRAEGSNSVRSSQVAFQLRRFDTSGAALNTIFRLELDCRAFAQSDL